MGFYDDMQGVATELLEEFKQGVITLTRITPGTPDPDQQWIPVSDTTETYLLAGTAKSVADKYVDGTTILATDSMVTCAATMKHTHTNGSPIASVKVNIEIQPGDVISIDGDAVTIIKEMRVPKAGTAVAWKIVVRG